MLSYFPKYCASKSIALYIVLLFGTSVLFFNKAMSWIWWVWGIVEVVGFFNYAYLLTISWRMLPAKRFQNNIIRTAFVIRLIYVFLAYAFYLMMTGRPFEFGSADAWIYHRCAEYMADGYRRGDFHAYQLLQRVMGSSVAIGDSGYPIYLSFVYWLSDDSILFARLLKAVWSTWTVYLIYKIAQRNFGEPTARMAAVFTMLMPNFIYYCGIHLKETEMVFLAVLFIERADALLRAPKLKVFALVVVCLIGLILMTFRTPLGVVAFMALGCSLILSSGRLMGWTRRIVVGGLALAFLATAFGAQLQEEVREVWEGRTAQKANMEWRAEREGGNSLAKYAGAAVFAPMIFTIPFPTMVETPGQENQRMIHGGNYVKNVVSGFTIFALFWLLFTGNWRRHVLVLSFLCGYLLVLTFSNFAHSERFHLPTLPFVLMMAAFGITQWQPKQKKWLMYWLVFIGMANFAWAWFKLAGRGMV